MHQLYRGLYLGSGNNDIFSLTLRIFRFRIILLPIQSYKARGKTLLRSKINSNFEYEN